MALQPVPKSTAMMAGEQKNSPVWLSFFDGLYLSVASMGKTGSTKSRPTGTPVGTMYFDIDLGCPIWASVLSSGGRNTWVDAAGIEV